MLLLENELLQGYMPFYSRFSSHVMLMRSHRLNWSCDAKIYCQYFVLPCRNSSGFMRRRMSQALEKSCLAGRHFGDACIQQICSLTAVCYHFAVSLVTYLNTKVLWRISMIFWRCCQNSQLDRVWYQKEPSPLECRDKDSQNRSTPCCCFDLSAWR